MTGILTFVFVGIVAVILMTVVGILYIKNYIEHRDLSDWEYMDYYD